ncbi:MAG TPA: hypothetical protein VHT27_05225 [Solirubrobacteraceae bacterium]|jgi:hypothetical protein|nr:hypothetical protein [Solirubrobacteraceae bacterium]
MRVVLGLAAALIVLLVLAQLILPGIAADRIRDKVGRYGRVQSVSVSAWPAIELLWGSVDSVRLRASSLRLNPARSASLLAEARGVSRLDASVGEVHEEALRLTDATLTKRGSALAAQGTVSAADAAAALPTGVSVVLLGSQEGAVRLRVSGGLFGVGTTIEAIAQASEGRLVARPAGGLLGAFGLTLFADPRIYVEAVGARALSASPPTYVVSMNARLR